MGSAVINGWQASGGEGEEVRMDEKMDGHFESTGSIDIYYSIKQGSKHQKIANRAGSGYILHFMCIDS